MNTAIRLAAGLAAAALLAAGCGPARSSGTPPRPSTIPALASGGGTPASMGLAEPAYPVPARVEYRVQGTLPTLPSEALAYRLGEDTSTQAVSRLASALGVSGAVSSDAQGWTVTGSASSLRVERAPGLPWELAQSGGGVGIGYSGCAVAMPGRVAVPPGVAPAPSTVAPASPPACVQPTPVPGLPSRTDAEQRATAALRAAGLDLTGAHVEASGGIGEWFVSITPSVGGIPLTGAGWSVTVGPHDAVVSASGWLAPPAGAGDYPLVGVQAGLDRLRAGGRWILRGGPGPVPLLGIAAGGTNIASSAGSAPPAVAAPPAQVAPVAPAPPVAPVPLPTKGAPVPASAAPLPVTVLTVTSVHLGLAWGTPAGETGEAWLVPVYVFELSGGGTVPVIAVADGLLATPAPVTPGVKILPAPAPAGPPGAPTTPNR
jgi:hypothetical protein